MIVLSIGVMKGKRIIIIGIALLFLSCGNRKGSNYDEPYDGGQGIGIDTATVNEFKESHMPPPPDSDRFDGYRPPPPPDGKHPDVPPPPSPDGKGRSPHKPDNMRGFDPPSEDDMDDNGMSRYMENNDDEGWN